jgi:hypothetical protein
MKQEPEGSDDIQSLRRARLQQVTQDTVRELVCSDQAKTVGASQSPRRDQVSDPKFREQTKALPIGDRRPRKQIILSAE